MALFLKVEIEPGTSEGDAARELADLAERLCITVQAEHCEVAMIARPDQSWDDVLREYKRDCRLAQYPQD